MAEIKALRLLAEDTDDLGVVSAALQDSVLKAENLKYDARKRQFTVELNRFRWEDEGANARVRALLAINSVLSVKTRAVTKRDPDLVLSLLRLTFEPGEHAPGGVLHLLFAGDGELALEVEAIDVTLLDSDYHWPARDRPDHDRKRR